MKINNTNYKKQLECIRNVKEKDCQRSFSFLLNEYKPLLITYTNYFKNKYPEIPADKEDVMNQLRGDFYQLILKYSEEKGKYFGSYIKEFLYLKSNSEIRKFSNKKFLILNYANYKIDPEFLFDIPKENYEEEIENIILNKNLSNIERKITKEIINGLTIKEIGQKNNLKIKNVYSIKARAITKLNKTKKTNI